MSDWTEIVLYANGREYDTRGIRNDDPERAAALVRWVGEFKAEFVGEPELVTIGRRMHVHAMDERCKSHPCVESTIWASA